jgi:hypothetical protein
MTMLSSDASDIACIVHALRAILAGLLDARAWAFLEGTLREAIKKPPARHRLALKASIGVSGIC